MGRWDNSSPRLGYACVILAAVLWAASGSVAKFLFQGGLSPYQLVQLRTTISSVALLAGILITKPMLLKIDRRDAGLFLLLGIALGATQFTYLYAISKIHVAAAILLQYQAPLLIAAYSVLFARRRLGLSTGAAIAGAIFGCYLMVGGYNLDVVSMNKAGILSGLASAVAFAVYSVKSEEGMAGYAPWTVLAYALLFAAILWNVLQPPLEAFTREYSRESWLAIIFVGLFGTIFPYGLYNEGISRIRATHASITATLEPVVAGVIAYLFLSEVMEPWQILGSLLVIGSIVLLQMRREPG